MKYFKLIIYILILFSFTSSQYAKELLIYADNIDYDSNKNLVAKGKVKLISKNEIITSELVIICSFNTKHHRVGSGPPRPPWKRPSARFVFPSPQVL